MASPKTIRHIFEQFGGENLLANPNLLDPSRAKGKVQAVDAANIDTYRTGILAKRLGKEQQGPDITGTAYSQTLGGTDLNLIVSLASSNTVSFYQKFTPSTNFDFFRASGRVRFQSTATSPLTVISHIYSDSAGTPGSILASSATYLCSALGIPFTGFKAVNLVYTPYTVTAGTTYWISFEFNKPGSSGAVSVTMDSVDLGDSDVLTKLVSTYLSHTLDLWYEFNTGVVQGIYDYRFSRNCDTPTSLVMVVIDGGVYFTDPTGSYIPVKYAGITPDPSPPLGSGGFPDDYLTATTAERSYSFISDSSGFYTNGDVGSVITP